MDPLYSALTALIAAILVGGWTGAWLLWSFEGDVRAWSAALLFPDTWLDGADRGVVARMSPAAFTKWLVGSSRAPELVAQVMTCRFCLSAHIAAAGALVVWLTVGFPAAALPLVWAAGAALGNLIYGNSK